MIALLVGYSLIMLTGRYQIAVYFGVFFAFTGAISLKSFRSARRELQRGPPISHLQDETRYAVLANGGRDVRISVVEPKAALNALSFAVTFGTPSGKYYRSRCDWHRSWTGKYQPTWAHEPEAILADQFPGLEVDVRGIDEKSALEAEAQSIQELNLGKERLMDLLSSNFRNERMWGIKLSAEMGVTDGAVFERLQEIAESDPVKAIREAATASLLLVWEVPKMISSVKDVKKS